MLREWVLKQEAFPGTGMLPQDGRKGELQSLGKRAKQGLKRAVNRES